MNKRIILILVALCTFVVGYAQRANSLRINEVLPHNTDNYMDEYGERSGWIEIFNTSRGTVDIAACYLTNDISNPKKYMIPKGDVLTKVRPRQHVLFWANNKPHHGNFYLNFELDPTRSNVIYLFNSDGKELVDSVVVPVCKPNVSWARVLDGETFIDQPTWGYFEKVTPSTNNKILDSNEKIQRLDEQDQNGIGMSFTAMLVVFVALIILYLVFKWIGNTSQSLKRKRAAKASGKDESAVDVDVEGEVFAAIAMAIQQLNSESHDLEDTVITIENVTRNYSPWSSKIYGLRETPLKK